MLERMLRREMYGDDWRRRLAELGGDEAAMRELERQRRLEFERMMKLRLLNRNRKKPGVDEEDLLVDLPVDWFDVVFLAGSKHF